MILVTHIVLYASDLFAEFDQSELGIFEREVLRSVKGKI